MNLSGKVGGTILGESIMDTINMTLGPRRDPLGLTFDGLWPDAILSKLWDATMEKLKIGLAGTPYRVDAGPHFSRHVTIYRRVGESEEQTSSMRVAGLLTEMARLIAAREARSYINVTTMSRVQALKLAVMAHDSIPEADEEPKKGALR